MLWISGHCWSLTGILSVQMGIMGSVLAEARSSRQSGQAMTVESRIAVERANRPAASSSAQLKGVHRKPWSVWFDATATMPGSKVRPSQSHCH